MDTKEMTREQISAFADGELADQHVDGVLASLRRADGRAEWEKYHQIGDVLRSDDMDVKLSPDFAARMAARLEREPIFVSPVAVNNSATGAMPIEVDEQMSSKAIDRKRPIKRWTMPGMAAAAAMAVVAYVTTPHLMVAMTGAPVTVASTGDVTSSANPGLAPADVHAAVVSANVPEGVVLRDPRIDDYLLAHQRFSPSVYSTAQYARSATFATDSTK